MTLRLNGSTSGYTELDAPASAGNNTLRLPTGNGLAGSILGTDGAGNLSWVNGGRMVLETAKASTSGTSVDFTGIPSWVKKITAMFVGVSTNGSGGIQVQVGSGSYSTSGYVSSAGAINAGVGQGGSTTGLIITYNTIIPAANSISGLLCLTLLGGNQWVSSGNVQYNLSVGAIIMTGGNTPVLAGSLDRLRVATINGTDTFDAGSINILYEG